MIGAYRTFSEELFDRGIFNLTAALVAQAKSDYKNAYFDYQEVVDALDRNSPNYDFVMRARRRQLESSRSFFRSRLFANILGAFTDRPPEDYLKALDKEIRMEYLKDKGERKEVIRRYVVV